MSALEVNDTPISSFSRRSLSCHSGGLSVFQHVQVVQCSDGPLELGRMAIDFDRTSVDVSFLWEALYSRNPQNPVNSLSLHTEVAQ
jgi:hypothetical protein